MDTKTKAEAEAGQEGGDLVGNTTMSNGASRDTWHK